MPSTTGRRWRLFLARTLTARPRASAFEKGEAASLAGLGDVSFAKAAVKREGHQQARGTIRAVGPEKVGDEYPPYEVVVAVVFAAPIGVVDVVELIFHDPFFGTLMVRFEEQFFDPRKD